MVLLFLSKLDIIQILHFRISLSFLTTVRISVVPCPIKELLQIYCTPTLTVVRKPLIPEKQAEASILCEEWVGSPYHHFLFALMLMTRRVSGPRHDGRGDLQGWAWEMTSETTFPLTPWFWVLSPLPTRRWHMIQAVLPLASVVVVHRAVMRRGF